jgi:hypothetical protein
MNYPLGFIDDRKLQMMSAALAAAAATVRLAGHEPSEQSLLAMARRIASEASLPDATQLTMVEAGLDGSWS